MNKWTNLIEIADIITGFPFKGEKYSTTGIRTVRGENVTEGRLRWDNIKCWNTPFDQEENYLLKTDDIVIGMDGSKVGKNMARIRKNDLPLLLAQRVACVRSKKGNNQIYLYYLINNPRFKEYVFKTQTGSSVPHISRKQIEDFKVPVFDLSTQQKIGSILSTLDDKIELNNKINKELEANAKTLYDYWFVQFDFPNKDGKPYKSSGGKMVYNEVLKREIPEGFNVTKLSELTSFLSRGISPNYVEGKGGIPVLNQKCIREHRVSYQFQRRHDNVTKNTTDKLIQKYDVLVNSTGVGTLGRVALVRWLNEKEVTVDSHVTIVRAISEKINRVFFGYSLLTKQAEIESFANGSTGQVELSRSQLSDVNLVVPPPNLQDRFCEYYQPIIEKTSINERQNCELVQLRDWLLPMLMNGQVKVGDNYNTDNSDILVAAESDVCYGSIESLDIPSNRKGFARQVLAGKVVSIFKNDPNFTSIKFQKIQFLAEHIIEVDLNQNYYYQAAGPYDNLFMKSIYGHFKAQNWFDSQNKRFVPLVKEEKIEGYYQGYFGSMQESLDKLFGLLYQTTEAEAEIIATIYAVWNNRIIEDTSITDGELIEDFYRWSDRKQQYTNEQIMVGLKWLRDNNLAPKGFGKLIKKAKGK